MAPGSRPTGTGRLGRPSRAASLAGAASLIAVLTVASRIVGFGRWVAFGWTVGANDLGAIYQVVNTVPNVIFEIVAGGALASLVVPLLAGAVARGDRAAVSATASALLVWTLTLLVPLAVVVAVFTEPIVGLLAEKNVTPAELDTGVRLLRVFAPQLPLYGIGIVLTGVLHAHRRFAWPVLAPLLSSLTVIVAYLAFAMVEGRHADLPTVGRTGELILSVGTTIGVVVLTLSLLIPVRRLHLRWRPTYRFAGEARQVVSGLAVAGAATVGAQQVALLVALSWGWRGPEGTPVHYSLAQAVYLLPWAVLAVPLATAVYPRLAAAGSERDTDRYANTLAPAARGVLLLSFLGVAGLIVVAGPAAVLLGAERPDTIATTIVGLAPGLLGYALFALLSRALYARAATAAAGLVTVSGWAVAVLATIGLSAVLPHQHRALALALGNSVGMLVLGAALVAVVLRQAGREALAGLRRTAAVGALGAASATLIGRGVGWLAGRMLDATPAEVAALGQGMLSGGVAVAVFLAVAYRLDRHDARPLILSVWHRPRPPATVGEGSDGE